MRLHIVVDLLLCVEIVGSFDVNVISYARMQSKTVLRYKMLIVITLYIVLSFP